MTHTPRPWSLMQPPYDSIPWHHVYGPDHNGAHIMHGSRSAEEKMANARLIASAPDLLEALEAIVNAGWRERNSFLNAGRAAIARARGESA